jgi:hypothetical protein
LDVSDQYTDVQGRLRCRLCFVAVVVQGFGLLDLCVSLCVVTLRRESLATLDCWNAMEAVMGAIDDKERSDAYLEGLRQG